MLLLKKNITKKKGDNKDLVERIKFKDFVEEEFQEIETIRDFGV